MEGVLELPKFNHLVFDKNKDYGYGKSGDLKRSNLKNLLLEITSGYCMYCFKKIVIDGDSSYGELEHTVEKEFGKFLEDCHYNMGISCRHCNGSSKKVEQKKRAISTKYLRCNKEKCKDAPCDNYSGVLKSYIENMRIKDIGKIITQPIGVKDYRLIFDLELLEFAPYPNINHSKEDMEYIESHIRKFKLNDPDLKTKVVTEVLDDIIHSGKLPRKDKKYENLVGNIFVEYLYRENLSEERLLDYAIEKRIELIATFN